MLYNETAVSGNDSLDSGPEPPAGLRHGVPVEGAHQHLYILDQVLYFVVWLCIAYNSEAPAQNSPKCCRQVSWEARPTCSTPPAGSP
jgi:hypothetical protein